MTKYFLNFIVNFCAGVVGEVRLVLHDGVVVRVHAALVLQHLLLVVEVLVGAEVVGEVPPPLMAQEWIYGRLKI